MPNKTADTRKTAAKKSTKSRGRGRRPNAEREVPIVGSLGYIRDGESRYRAVVDKVERRKGGERVVKVHTTREKKQRVLPITEFHVLDRTPDRAD